MKTKKIWAVLLAILMCLTSSITAFATDEIPAVTPHTITIEVPAGESGVMPLIWGQFSPGIMDGVVYNTPSFYVPDPHFAYEVYATAMNGNPVNEPYAVSLMMGNGVKAHIQGTANGSHYKNDWISVTSGNYYFRINNATSYNLSVYITYYSWP